MWFFKGPAYTLAVFIVFSALFVHAVFRPKEKTAVRPILLSTQGPILEQQGEGIEDGWIDEPKAE